MLRIASSNIYLTTENKYKKDYHQDYSYIEREFYFLEGIANPQKRGRTFFDCGLQIRRNA